MHRRTQLSGVVLHHCMKFRLAHLLTAVVLVVANSLQAETAAELIARARAYLGTESALSAVTSIHYTGTLEIAVAEQPKEEKGSSPGELQRLPMEIICQKPYQQMMTVNRPDSVDTMVLDDYDGWSRNAMRQNPKKWKLALLDGEQIKQLRANTWENLNFYGGLEKQGGTVQMGGDVTVDGVVCTKLSFMHSDRIGFHRYFEKATGRLVKTETSNGSEIREEGELMADGIRFPKRIVNKSATGQVTTIVFDKIVLNEHIPVSAFAVPSFLSD